MNQRSVQHLHLEAPAIGADHVTSVNERAFYADSIGGFLDSEADQILGVLARNNSFGLDPTQRDAWMAEIAILRSALGPYRGRGKIYLEYSIPRLGKRVDAVAVIDQVIFVIEFKVGERTFSASATDQVCDYALDLKNFHETSHRAPVAPILVATLATSSVFPSEVAWHADGLMLPIHAAPAELGASLARVLTTHTGPTLSAEDWERGRYYPTPTIIEAAMALYGGHGVSEISRSDAGAVNLSRTSHAVSEIIASSRAGNNKSVCFVTGVPGAGKTLVGLDIATTHIDKESELYSVFLSGNGPLVAVLREALARDKIRREAERGNKIKKGTAMSEVKLFIQNVHHFRDECLVDIDRPPAEHVALFDEAQRAWNTEQTAKFMLRKKQTPDFAQSEPQFLLSCLDRHRDWAVVVCLVGGGQEINTGEAGITEWIDSVRRAYPDWHIHISPQLKDTEYGAGKLIDELQEQANVHFNDDLHLAVSMRSFRAEHVSLLVKQLLDLDELQARNTLQRIHQSYPIVVTRDLKRAKEWLTHQARGSERYGIAVSSQAQRLKPHAIDVRSPMDPVHWFLDGKEDVRSSYYLEDAATEFHVQGLELDWACIVWDADFRHGMSGWQHFSFVGSRWNRVNKPERRVYLKNAYRVLLTRARQGMVIVVPYGDEKDATRLPAYYDSTFEYLERIGFSEI
jgi:hypothetical protein